MKKIFIVISMFLVIENNFSQLPNGSIAPDFTATDIDGVEHNLYNLLDQGKSVILDFSTTWCGPCWTFHESGISKEVWNLYGPEGTDEIYVFLIECDEFTGMDELLGGGANPTGNWVEGTPYPIIDDHTFQRDYSVGGWPTIFHVCPNRKTFHQHWLDWSTEGIYDLHNSCGGPVGATNASILNLHEYEIGECGSLSFTPTITFQNLGSITMESAEIVLSLDGNIEETIDWVGLMPTFTLSDVVFSEITLMSGVDLEISINSVNGMTDEDLSDNKLEQYVTNSAAETSEFTVEVKTFNDGADIYWAIENENGDILADGGNELVGLTNINTGLWASAPAHPSAYGNFQIYTETVNVPIAGCYNLVVTDHFGDGFIPDIYSNGVLVSGFYNLRNQAGQIILSGDEFSDGIIRHPFEKLGSVSTKNVSKKSIELNVFPNPAGNIINIGLENYKAGNLPIEIFNSFGESVQKDVISSSILNLDISNYAPGVYTIVLSTGETITRTFVKL